MTAPTLVEFLTARLDEDEAWAHDALSRRFAPIPQPMERPNTIERVLADVKAKRAIVGGAVRMAEARQDLVAPSGVIVRHLASVYADHPDYDATWAP